MQLVARRDLYSSLSLERLCLRQAETKPRFAEVLAHVYRMPASGGRSMDPEN